MSRPLPGDMVLLPPEDGLGTGAFLVLRVFSLPPGCRDLEVMGRNGQVWHARSQGARVISRPDPAAPTP